MSIKHILSGEHNLYSGISTEVYDLLIYILRQHQHNSIMNFIEMFPFLDTRSPIEKLFSLMPEAVKNRDITNNSIGLPENMMDNLFLLNETFTNGLSYNTINLITVTSISCGIFVVISKNPIVSVLFLIGLFLNIAGYLMMLGMNFIGLSYLLVYVGAVSILFLFILMLINVRISELTSDTSNSIPLAVIIGIIFIITLYKLLPSNIVISNVLSTQNYILNIKGNSLNSSSYLVNNNELLFVTSHIWDGALVESSHITSIGNITYTSYPVWLILTSLILLLAMVGAIVITIKQ